MVAVVVTRGNWLGNGRGDELSWCQGHSRSCRERPYLIAEPPRGTPNRVGNKETDSWYPNP